jgi:hypothetical protein
MFSRDGSGCYYKLWRQSKGRYTSRADTLQATEETFRLAARPEGNITFLPLDTPDLISIRDTADRLQ